MNKTAVVILSHFFDRSVLNMFRRMRAETSGRYDIFVAINLGSGELCAPEETCSVGDALFLCNTKKLLALAYPEKCRPEGWSGEGWKAIDNPDTIMLSFYHDHPGYSFYWGVEYDVHYQGKWGFLFERFESSGADLLGIMLDRATKVSRILMPPLRDQDGKPPDYRDAVIGFYPIYRVSASMLRQIDACYRQGWNGHYEFTWGTMAKRHGLTMEDIGGNGPYVKPHNKNVFYFNTIKRWDLSPGTFIFRPPFTKIPNRENTLWHPVKPKGDHFNHCPAEPEKNLYGWTKRIVKSIIYKAAIWLWFHLYWRPASSSPVPGLRHRQTEN